MCGKDKIYLFIPSLDVGGAEIVSIRLFNSLSKIDKDINLLTLNNTGKLISIVDPKDRVLAVNRKSLIDAIIPLIKFLKKNNGLYVVVMTQPALLFLFINFIFRLKRKIIVIEHSPLHNWFKVLGKVKTKFYMFALKRLYTSAAKIVTVSNQMKIDLDNLLNKPNLTLHLTNPIITPDINDLANSETEDIWNKYKMSKRLLFVGRLSKEKNIGLMIRAFEKLIKTYSNVHLFIIGEGSEHDGLIRMVDSLKLNGYVHFLGYKKNPYPYIKSADAILLSSIVEGFPTVLAEAQYFGRPLVSTNCKSGPDEIIISDEYGELVGLNDISAYCKAIEKVVFLNVYDSDKIKNLSDKYVAENSALRYYEMFQVVSNE